METIALLPGGIQIDDRGSVSFINDFDFAKYQIRRSYVVKNHRVGFVRAWHGHYHENKFVTIINGAALFGVVPIQGSIIPSNTPPDIFIPKKFILCEQNPAILHIPGGYAHGFKTLIEGTTLVFYSTATLEDSSKDDIRFPWNKWDIWDENFR